MEYKFVELAQEKLHLGKPYLSIRKQIHDKSAPKDQSGMICSGEQTLLLYLLQPHDLFTVQELLNCLEKGKNGLLQISPTGLNFDKQAVTEVDFSYSFKSEFDWLYQEKIGYKHHLHIIGGGHCALALAKIMQPMDFYLHLYEDRTDLNTFQQNQYVHQKTVIEEYSHLSELIPSGEHQYVVLMTFGYRTDDLALRALLHKKFKYCGMLGSQKKIEKLMQDYKQEGLSSPLLNSLHAPIGLPINSQTPEEIAISIAAQIIQKKNHAVLK